MLNTSSTPIPLESLQTGKHVMILESHDRHPAGLLLCRRYTADLILADSLVGGSVDARGFVRAIPLGRVRLTLPTDAEAREVSFERRMQSITRQQGVIGEPVALDRAQKLLNLLYAIFDRGVINTIADADLAKAAGVLASTMSLAKQRLEVRQHPAVALEAA